MPGFPGIVTGQMPALSDMYRGPASTAGSGFSGGYAPLWVVRPPFWESVHVAPLVREFLAAYVGY